MAQPITGISSMATRRVLAELTHAYEAATGERVAIEAIGGVEAAKRVRAGEAFDVVALAANAMAGLEAEGHVLAGSVVGFVRSPMALAVRAGAQKPDIHDAQAVRAALTATRSIGYSTGPSGVHLLEVARSWGLDPAGDAPRFVQARPGLPVATLVAQGDAEIGVQQLSEFLDEPGIDVVGRVPAPLQLVTIFSIGVGARAARIEDAEALIAFLTAPETADTKRRLAMEPA
jgi:molybdate transport system substrate-binding protein